MPVLDRPKDSYAIPTYNEGFIGANSLTQDFVIVYGEYASIHNGSIVIRGMETYSEENKAAIGRIKSLKLLEDNWDEEGAKKIPEVVISRALDIIKHINRFGGAVYLATPGPNEEILLMLKTGSREVEIIIYPNKEKFLKFDGTKFVEQGNFLGQELSVLLEWIEA